MIKKLVILKIKICREIAEENAASIVANSTQPLVEKFTRGFLIYKQAISL